MVLNMMNIPTYSDLYLLIKTRVIQRIFRSYATVFFCYSPLIGAWFALMSFASPRTAASGIFSLICAWIWGSILLIKPPGDLHLVNSLLCGLFLSAYYPISTELFVGLALITFFITVCVSWFYNFMWSIGKVPLMTMPFVLGTWLLILIFQHKQLVLLPSMIFFNGDLPEILSWSWTNDFFSTIGGLLLVPYSLIGALVFIGIFFASRYLALLAISGYVVGALTLYFLGYHFLIIESGYNCILTALAIGGIFMIPGLFSFFTALCGSALTSVFIVSLYKLLFPLQLPLLVLPFLLSSYFLLGGLSYRSAKNRAILNLDNPISPELSSEQYRLNKARGLYLNSIFIDHKFLHEWQVASNNSINPIYFICLESSKLTEPTLHAPVNGSVIELRDSDKDNYQKTTIDEHWGNLILLRDYSGAYILLSFLQAGTVKTQLNQWVSVGQAIANYGKQSSGEYLYNIQVQTGVRTTSKKIDYHLTNVLISNENSLKYYKLFYYPVVGDHITSAEPCNELANAINLLPGLTLNYAVTHNNEAEKRMMLQTGIPVYGGTRLYAAKDKSMAYEKSTNTIVFYDLQGNSDILLNLWALSLSITPLTTQADIWEDEPSLKHWPLSYKKRLLIALFRPLGVNCKSQYTRVWDETAQIWVQKGTHKAHILANINWEAKTTALIDPKLGVIKISLELFENCWQAELLRG